MKNLVLTAIFVAIYALSVSAQNRFEGHNIILDVPTTQRATACAIRYAPPSTAVTITDLDRSTPLHLSSCGGDNSLVQGSGGTATTRTTTDYKWCFQGEDKVYRITFQGDQFS